MTKGIVLPDEDVTRYDRVDISIQTLDRMRGEEIVLPIVGGISP